MGTTTTNLTDAEFKQLLEKTRRSLGLTRVGRFPGKLLVKQPGESLCESPAEVLFYRRAKPKMPNLVPQVETCGYRLDFAIGKIAIEIDGHEYHKSPAQRTHDAARDRCLMFNGWMVVRFTGSEIWADVGGCVDETLKIYDALTERRNDDRAANC